jgi:hypothetical protein
MHIALSARTLAPHRGQESGLTSLRGSLTFLCTPVCVVLSSVGCRSPRLRSRSLRRAATDNEDAAPVGPAAATAVVPMGKGRQGRQGRVQEQEEGGIPARQGEVRHLRRGGRQGRQRRRAPGWPPGGAQPPAPGSLVHELHPATCPRPAQRGAATSFRADQEVLFARAPLLSALGAYSSLHTRCSCVVFAYTRYLLTPCLRSNCSSLQCDVDTRVVCVAFLMVGHT